MNYRVETAVFGGGCFWCTEAIFQRLKGIVSVRSGYTGGTVENPIYAQVSTGETGHVEAIKVEFDPDEIGYDDLLNVFFAMHDPTTLNRQGDDIGTQYRSAIFYTNSHQKKVAEKYIETLTADRTFDAPIVTELRPLEKFYDAETFHQEYYNNDPQKPYCQAVITPKLAKLRQKFVPLLKNS